MGKGGPRPRRYQPSAPHGTVFRRPQPRIQIDRGLAWYCLWTAPRAEARVADALREAGLAVYVPVEALAVARRGKLVEVQRPVLGRYVFVGLHPVRPEWEFVHAALDGPYGWMLGVPALGRVLKSAENIPLKVPAGALQRLANGLGGTTSGRSPPFRSGDTCRVINGVWQGFQAEILDSTDLQARGLLNLFGRKTVVSFDRSELAA